jgi:predicted homoserine dehydrogenase-like protein
VWVALSGGTIVSLLSDVNREIKAGVIGAGAFGRLHAQKYASTPGVKLVGIADADIARACERFHSRVSRLALDPAHIEIVTITQRLLASW